MLEIALAQRTSETPRRDSLGAQQVPSRVWPTGAGGHHCHGWPDALDGSQLCSRRKATAVGRHGAHFSNQEADENRRKFNTDKSSCCARRGCVLSLPVYIFPIFYRGCYFHNGKIIKLKLFVFDIFLIKKVIYVHWRQLGEQKRKLNSSTAHHAEPRGWSGAQSSNPFSLCVCIQSGQV